MDTFTLTELLKQLSAIQFILIGIASSIWFIGGSKLKTHHKKRLRQEGKKVNDILDLSQVNAKEWLFFGVILTFSFTLLIVAVNI